MRMDHWHRVKTQCSLISPLSVHNCCTAHHFRKSIQKSWSKRRKLQYKFEWVNTINNLSPNKLSSIWCHHLFRSCVFHDHPFPSRRRTPLLLYLHSKEVKCPNYLFHLSLYACVFAETEPNLFNFTDRTMAYFPKVVLHVCLSELASELLIAPSSSMQQTPPKASNRVKDIKNHHLFIVAAFMFLFLFYNFFIRKIFIFYSFD